MFSQIFSFAVGKLDIQRGQVGPPVGPILFSVGTCSLCGQGLLQNVEDRTLPDLTRSGYFLESMGHTMP